MHLFFYCLLFIYGTLFGSFASVVIHRLKSGETGIWTGRSHCKSCERNLSPRELIPIFSWLFQGGKCAGCRSKISPIYPILELCTGFLFLLAGLTLIDINLLFSGNTLELGRLCFFLFLIFLTIIYVFYDILYLEIPESVLIIANSVSFGALLAHGFGFQVIPYLPIGNFSIIEVMLSAGIISALYYVFLAGLKEVYDCLIVLACMGALGAYMYFYDLSYSSSALLSGTIAALGIYISFFLQIILSGGRAMGAGDLRIAILMGLLVGSALTFPAWMICYFIGSFIAIIIVAKAKIMHGWKAKFNHEVPFGPFIASGYLAVLFFSQQISKIIESHF